MLVIEGVHLKTEDGFGENVAEDDADCLAGSQLSTNEVADTSIEQMLKHGLGDIIIGTEYEYIIFLVKCLS